eukprot:15445891-Alexandrium_andersonii.AAC.1
MVPCAPHPYPPAYPPIRHGHTSAHPATHPPARQSYGPTAAAAFPIVPLICPRLGHSGLTPNPLATRLSRCSGRATVAGSPCGQGQTPSAE